MLWRTRLSCLVFDFTLCMSSDYTFVTFANNRIAFPVADAGFTVNDSWAFFNAGTVDDTSSTILFAITFTPLFLATQTFLSRLSQSSRLREKECGLINCPVILGRS